MGNKYYLQNTVVQVLGDKEKGLNSRIAFNGNSKQIVYVIGSSELNLLDDDAISVYGTFEGNYTYSSVVTDITIPRIDGIIEIDDRE